MPPFPPEEFAVPQYAYPIIDNGGRRRTVRKPSQPLPPTSLFPVFWNPLDKNANIVLSNGNLTASFNDSLGGYAVVRTNGFEGTNKIHFQVHVDADVSGGTNYQVGIANQSTSLSNYLGVDKNSIAVQNDGTILFNNAVIPGVNIGAFGTGDTITVEFDPVAKLIWFAKNTGPYNGSSVANPSAGVGGVSFSGMPGPYYAAWKSGGGTGTDKGTGTFVDPYIIPRSSGFINLTFNGGSAGADITAFFVSPTGSDSNPGTRLLPFLTLEKAQTAMQAQPSTGIKTTVLLAGSGGSYNRTQALTLTTSDNGTTWRYDPRGTVDSAVLDGGSSITTGIELSGAVANVTILGIKMQNFNNYCIHHDDNTTNLSNITIKWCDLGFTHALGTFDCAAILINGINGLNIINNYIHDTTYAGTLLNSYVAAMVLDNVEISGNVYLNNMIGNTTDGGACYLSHHGGYTGTSLKVENNFFRDTGTSGIGGVTQLYLDDNCNHVLAQGNIFGCFNQSINGGGGRTDFETVEIHNGNNNTIKNNIVDLGSTATEYEWMCFMDSNVIVSGMPGNSWINNVVVMKFTGNNNTNSSFGTGVAYAEANNFGTFSGFTIGPNMYHNYSGGQEASNGQVTSDSNPQHADPLLSGYLYTMANNAPELGSPINFTPIVGGWGPPGFTIPSSTNHSPP